MRKSGSNEEYVPSFARETASSRAKREPKHTNNAPSKPPIRMSVSSRPNSSMSIRPGSSISMRPGSSASVRPGSSASIRPGSSISMRRGSSTNMSPGSSTGSRPIPRKKDSSRSVARQKLVRLDEVEDEEAEKKTIFRKGLQMREEESHKSYIPRMDKEKGNGKGKGKAKAISAHTSMITPARLSDSKVSNVNVNVNVNANANRDNGVPARSVILNDDIPDIDSHRDHDCGSSEQSFYTACEYAGSFSERSFHTAMEWPDSEDDEVERQAARAFWESRLICEHWEASMEKDLEIREDIEMLRI
ncbi:hypothetical protein PENSTE_c024G06970 [Penicillium steckii]|uniref:Uncharacterized protein n=1 Tax=Penicillium steckii TaxID=303698 RepID=A0A1V6SRT4_9EURO|nr:hypothetical protein PENSTE_c024G06970 [Penicillium steckii]